MNKPEKKEFEHPCCQKGTCIECAEIEQHNQACDDWGRYHEEDINILNRRIMDLTNSLITLPTEEEISEMLLKEIDEYRIGLSGGFNQEWAIGVSDKLAKAIYKRIKGS